MKKAKKPAAKRTASRDHDDRGQRLIARESRNVPSRTKPAERTVKGAEGKTRR